MENRDLISPEYLQQLEMLREDKPEWGPGAGHRHLLAYQSLCLKYGNFSSVLDYGCGTGGFLDKLPCRDKRGYDPAVAKYAKLPEPAELVMSMDVLEHIEPELLDNVLSHIRACTLRFAYLHIHCAEAVAVLPDGRNAHICIMEPEEWHRKLEEYFPKVEVLKGPKRNWITFLASV
jgi:hypothetical protein